MACKEMIKIMRKGVGDILTTEEIFALWDWHRDMCRPCGHTLNWTTKTLLKQREIIKKIATKRAEEWKAQEHPHLNDNDIQEIIKNIIKRETDKERGIYWAKIKKSLLCKARANLPIQIKENKKNCLQSELVLCKEFTHVIKIGVGDELTNNELLALWIFHGYECRSCQKKWHLIYRILSVVPTARISG